MSAEEDARARREAWLEAGAHDYNVEREARESGEANADVRVDPGTVQRYAGEIGWAPTQGWQSYFQPSSSTQTAMEAANRTSSGGMAGVRAYRPPAGQTAGAGFASVFSDPNQLNYYSEKAAQWLASVEGIPIEQARTRLQLPEYETTKRGAIELIYTRENQPAPQQGGQQGGVAPAWWEEYTQAQQAGAQAEWDLKKREAEQRMALARTADERAEAALDVQRANQKLAESRFEQEKTTSAQTIAQNMLSTAATLRGPANYAQFMQYLSGGRDLWSQVGSSLPRPAFSAPTGAIAPANLQTLMSQMSAGGNGQSQNVPLPFQINPAVWDALGPVGQQMLLSMAESAGYDATEFVRQLNAARPMGTAPTQGVSYRYA